MLDKKSSASREFSPDEMGAMRFAYKTMRQEFPKRYTTEEDKRDLAKSIFHLLGEVEGENEKVVSRIMEE
jgi:hypothetical protein